jgi:hypothetical protein
MTTFRLKRRAVELRVRRRRLDAYRRMPDFPGKELAWRSEEARYGRFLIVAAEMLEVPTPELAPNSRLAADARAALEDLLALAGLDVSAPHDPGGEVIIDGDSIL